MFLDTGQLGGSELGTATAITSGVVATAVGGLATAIGFKRDQRSRAEIEQHAAELASIGQARDITQRYHDQALRQNSYWSWLSAGAAVVAVGLIPVELAAAISNHAGQLAQFAEFFAPTGVSGLLGTTFFAASQRAQTQAKGFFDTLQQENARNTATELVASIDNVAQRDQAKRDLALEILRTFPAAPFGRSRAKQPDAQRSVLPRGQEEAQLPSPARPVSGVELLEAPHDVTAALPAAVDEPLQTPPQAVQVPVKRPG